MIRSSLQSDLVVLFCWETPELSIFRISSWQVRLSEKGLLIYCPEKEAWLPSFGSDGWGLFTSICIHLLGTPQSTDPMASPPQKTNLSHSAQAICGLIAFYQQSQFYFLFSLLSRGNWPHIVNHIAFVLFLHFPTSRWGFSFLKSESIAFIYFLPSFQKISLCYLFSHLSLWIYS